MRLGVIVSVASIALFMVMLGLLRQAIPTADAVHQIELEGGLGWNWTQISCPLDTDACQLTGYFKALDACTEEGLEIINSARARGTNSYVSCMPGFWRQLDVNSFRGVSGDIDLPGISVNNAWNCEYGDEELRRLTNGC